MKATKIENIENLTMSDVPELCNSADHVFDRRKKGEKAEYTEGQKMALVIVALTGKEPHLLRSGASAFCYAALLELGDSLQKKDPFGIESLLKLGEGVASQLLGLPDEFYDLLAASLKLAYLEAKFDGFEAEPNDSGNNEEKEGGEK